VRSGLPAVYPFREFTEAGGLISYGPRDRLALVSNGFRRLLAMEVSFARGADRGSQKRVRDLIRRMSLENPLGATKIHGELLKLGIQVAQSTVSIYMVPRSDRPLQTWKTFVRNHMEGISSAGFAAVAAWPAAAASGDC
jgi:hypothetical protein